LGAEAIEAERINFEDEDPEDDEEEEEEDV
jgi:hypothetical protein